MIPRRVVITGFGLITPLGCGGNDIWNQICDGKCGISKLPELIACGSTSVHVAGIVPRGTNERQFDCDAVIGKGNGREMSNATQFALGAAALALMSAKLIPNTSNINMDKFGVAIGSGGIGSLQDIIDGLGLMNKSFRHISPYFVPKILINMSAGHVSIKYGLRGPCHSAATACAAGTHSIGDAFNFIRLGQADAMVAGGTESNIHPLAASGFARLKALSTKEDPNKASSPFDSSRDGFVMAEGAGLVVLEELEQALARGAPIVAEVLGYGLSGDAHHITSPAPVVEQEIETASAAAAVGRQQRQLGGAVRAMQMALSDARVAPAQVGYINAHATSTPVGDAVEAAAIDALFGASTRSRLLVGQCASSQLYVSSTKGATGHLLGASGAVETIFTALALRDGIIPPTLNLNLEEPQPQSQPQNPQFSSFKHACHSSIAVPELRYAINNSFGFGGTNAVLLLGKYCG